jgi:phosphonoacetaldehyde hydrolase
MGMAKREHIRGLLAMDRVRAAWLAARGAAPAETDVDALHDAVEPLMRASAARCATLIPGAADVVRDLRAQGIKIGSGTGYTRTMMADILPLAAAQGYAPDTVVCSGDTPLGRPTPLMTWKALAELSAWPVRACVKVDDAAVGVAEGAAAGVWSVGLAGSGNGVGLPLAEYQALPTAERESRVAAAGKVLTEAGADFVIETVAQLPDVLRMIEGRLAAGEGPKG